MTWPKSSRFFNSALFCAALAALAACAPVQVRLNDAVLTGDNQQVAHLLTHKGVDVNAAVASSKPPAAQCGYAQLTPLAAAVCAAKPETVTLLLEHGAQPDTLLPGGGTALTMAASRNQADITKLLIERGADVDAKDLSGDTALIDAVWNGETDLIKLLLSNHADVNARKNDGNSALTLAAYKGQTDVVGMLLDAHANINIRDSAGDTPLIDAVWNDKTDTAKFLIAHKANVNDKKSDGNSALSLAAYKGQIDVVKMLLDQGADINARDSKSGTPLMNAAVSGNPDLIELLLDRGADMKMKNSNQATALVLAVSQGKADAVRVFLKHKDDLEAKNINGATPLAYAAYEGLTGIAQALIEAGANIEARNKDGDTPLLLAAKMDKADAASFLLSHGAKLDAKNAQGQTALDAARAAGAASVVSVLLDKQLAQADALAQSSDVAKAFPLYMSAFSAAGNDQNLVWKIRAKMVQAAVSSGHAPAVPPQARQNAVQGKYLADQGISNTEAENDLWQALQAAPWWSEGYYDYGMALAKAAQYADAINILNFFVTNDPKNSQASHAQDKIYELQAAQQEAQKMTGLSGAWSDGANAWNVSVSGNQLTAIVNGSTLSAILNKRAFKGSISNGPTQGSDNCTIPGQNHGASGTVDPDAGTIDFDYTWSQYQTHSHCVNVFGQPSICCLLCTTVCDGVHVIGTNSYHVHLTR